MKVFLNSCVLIFVFISCQQQAKVVEQNPVVLPKTELMAVDKAFAWQQDVLFYNGKPYSGYVLDKYPNGKLAARNGYVNGKLEGIQEKWYENGSKMEVRFYTNNRKNGKHEGWYDNGQKRFEYIIKEDVPVATHREWYANGQLYTLFNYNSEGQPEGTQRMWYVTGQVKSNYIIKDGRRFGFLGAKGCMGEGEKKATGLKL